MKLRVSLGFFCLATSAILLTGCTTQSESAQACDKVFAEIEAQLDSGHDFSYKQEAAKVTPKCLSVEDFRSAYKNHPGAGVTSSVSEADVGMKLNFICAYATETKLCADAQNLKLLKK